MNATSLKREKLNKPEHRKTCSKCRKRKISKRYDRKVEGKHVFLCQECLDEETKAQEAIGALLSVASFGPRGGEEFESALKKAPGLFGRSRVTEDQMKLANAGAPQNFSDDFPCHDH